MKIPAVFRRVLAAVTNAEQPVQYRYSWLPSRQAGVVVDHSTALTNSAVWACVRTISEDVAKLPWKVYQESGNGKTEAPGSTAYRLLNRAPNRETTAFSFREALLGHVLTHGNGYAEITRDRVGRPASLWLLNPERVAVKRDEDGTLIYEITSSEGRRVVPDWNIFHVHGLGYDGLVGYSVIGMARKAVGLGLAAEQFGSDFYANGTTASIHLSTPNRLSDTARTRLKADLDEFHQGVGKQFRPMVLEEGMRAENVSLPLADAQFVESRKFQVTDIARWYRVPPHKIQDLERATFTNIEAQAIEYVTDCLMPWAQRLEQEANRKLLPRDGNWYTKITLNALMRGDSAARSQFYREMLNLGALSPDEIRAYEDLDPIPGGDGAKFFMQMNMTTLDRVGEEPEPQSMQPQEPSEELISAHTDVLADMFERIYDRGERAKVNWVRNLIAEQVDLAAAAFSARGADYEVLIDTTTNSALEHDELPSDLARWTMDWVRQIAMAHHLRTAA